MKTLLLPSNCSRGAVLVLCGLLGASGLRASQMTLPVDASISTMTVTLCAAPGGLSQQCDTDSSSISGYLVVSLDDNGAPTKISVRNYDLQANDTLNLSLSWLFGIAKVEATASGLGLSHPTPGPQNPFYNVSGTTFTGTNVPYQTRGTASYNVSDWVCPFISPTPCSGVFDLSTYDPGAIDAVPGTVVVANGIATVYLDITVQQYLDETQPALGDLTVHAVVTASGPVPSGLVPLGSDWLYLDNGSDQGTAWQAPGFNDGGWPSGQAQLGYGDGDETTVISYGPDPNNKYITSYFRHAFNVPNPAIYTNLVLRVLRDDGAVVYLNGAEVFRSNIPDGDVHADVLARIAATGLEETVLLFAKFLSPSLLAQGRNVLAVEVHQNGAGSSDLSFDLELQGNFSFSNQPPSITILTPTNGAVDLGSALYLTASATDPDGLITLVEYFLDGVQAGQALDSPYGLTLPPLCPGTYTLTARAWDNSASSATSAPVTVKIIRPNTVLVATGTQWKYLDNGSDQGTAWRGTNFNDSAWASGAAQLGYGDGDEVTTVSYGPDGANKYITTFFRRKFMVNNASSILGLALHVLRDDGAVVYINEQEVWRNNMPAGAIDYRTLALTNAGGSDETTFFSSLLGAASLRDGTNVIAVEIHQGATNSTDISFDLQLDAGYPNLAPSVLIISPTNNAEIPAGQPLDILAVASDLDGMVQFVEFYDGTTKVGEAYGPTYSLHLPNPPSGRYVLTARAVDDCGRTNTSPPVAVYLGAFSLVKPGAVWKYRDNGVYPGDAWRGLSYDDGSWSSGPAELGYGDGDEARVVSYGPDINNKYITTWYRRAWEVPDKSVLTGLTIRLLRDDGAVVYLNGIEVFRSNMPNTPITPTTLATNGVADAEETAWFSKTIPPGLLQNGTNLLAVEIHQVSATSTDTSFNLEVVGTVNPMPCSATVAATPDGNIVVRWPSWAVGLAIYWTDDIMKPPAEWGLLSVPVHDDGAWRTAVLPASGEHVFYRLAY